MPNRQNCKPNRQLPVGVRILWDKVPIQITQNATLGKSENALVGLHSDFKHFFDGYVGFF